MSSAPPPPRQLSDEAYVRIDRELSKYPADQKQSAVMSSLGIAQDEKGWLSPEIMDEIAIYLGMPPIAVYEVASFYTMYNLQPQGRFKLSVCTNLPCALRDGGKAGEFLKERLGVDYGETSADGLFTLKESECLGACADAPVMLVNDRRMCSFMNNERLDQLLAELRERAAAGPDGH